ncbi:hypothetical protein J1614_008331 [Plenodomus biglobosus]|nr:hypothetical protein J1614_008331 [Plenodomus biglobosus]
MNLLHHFTASNALKPLPAQIHGPVIPEKSSIGNHITNAIYGVETMIPSLLGSGKLCWRNKLTPQTSFIIKMQRQRPWVSDLLRKDDSHY